MSNEFLPVTLADGTRLQSGIPCGVTPNQPYQPHGLFVRGVVVATYLVDDNAHPQNDGRAAKGAGGRGALSVYCDVLVYSGFTGGRFQLVPQCLVLQDRGGLHDGRVWRPKAASINITGQAYSLEKATNPAYLDGDHVLVGFMDGQLNAPIIFGGIPHPSADQGAEESTQRQRLQLRLADGDPEFWKHHGSKYGVETNGDFSVDTRFANDGALNPDGSEPLAPVDGKGAQRFDLPLDAEYSVRLFSMADPENPEKKAELQINKDRVVATLVDQNTKIEITQTSITLDVEGGVNPITITNGQIQLGGTQDKAVTLSGINGELNRLRDDHNALADAVAKHRHPSEMYFFPLIPNPGQPLAQFVKSPVEYLTKTNLILAEDAVACNAPLDESAGLGEFVPPIPPDPNNITRESGLFPGSSVIGDPSSTLVTLKS